MDDINSFFLKTLTDISERLSLEDPYEILMISGLIRKLFLDEYPLVDQVNKTYRLKLIFEVCVSNPFPQGLPSPTFWSMQDGFDPNTAPPFKKRQEVNRDQFFKILVLIVNGHQYTVKDIVLFQAHIMGAVHAGAAKTEKEEILKSIERSISIGGYTASLRQLKAIARVILKAMVPLRAAAGSA